MKDNHNINTKVKYEVILSIKYLIVIFLSGKESLFNSCLMKRILGDVSFENTDIFIIEHSRAENWTTNKTLKHEMKMKYHAQTEKFPLQICFYLSRSGIGNQRGFLMEVNVKMLSTYDFQTSREKKKKVKKSYLG